MRGAKRAPVAAPTIPLHTLQRDVPSTTKPLYGVFVGTQGNCKVVVKPPLRGRGGTGCPSASDWLSFGQLGGVCSEVVPAVGDYTDQRGTNPTLPAPTW